MPLVKEQKWVRIKTDIFEHRKMFHLRNLIGDRAFGIIPQLFVFAGRMQNDGDFSKFTSSQLALALHYDESKIGLYDALIQSGWMDSDFKIHDWDEHNGWHSARIEGSSKGGKKTQELLRKEQEEEDKKIALVPQKQLDESVEKLKQKISSWFRRRPSTQWSDKELKSLKLVCAAGVEDEDLKIMEEYYTSQCQFLRRDIPTLLNNWNGELDRARKRDWINDGKPISRDTNPTRKNENLQSKVIQLNP